MAEEQEQKTMTIEDIEKLLTVKQLSEALDIRAGVIRREAKKGKIPGCYSIFGRYGFDPVKVQEWVPPEAGARVGKLRDDGRKRYVIYLNTDELATLQEQYEITDPAVAAKARRAARKAKKAAEASASEAGEVDVSGEAEKGQDPFKDF